MVGLNSINSVPNWLLNLMEERFFIRCLIHESVKKNEKNIFCLDCCTSICLHCLPLHRPHLLLQIRRYMYNDVIRLSDAQKLLNCSLVQPYTTNRAKVVFLKQRPNSRTLRGSCKFCIICDRSLQDPYIFCSLSCKVHHLLLSTKRATMKESWNKCEFSVLVGRGRSSENPQENEDSQITPDRVLDTSTLLCSMSPSTSTSSGGGTGSLKANCSASATTEFFKRKRGSVHLVPRIWCLSSFTTATDLAIAVNRRKGVPHRSPLY